MGAIVIQSTLGAAPGLLDALAWPEGEGYAFRLFFAAPAPRDRFTDAPRPGCAEVLELREVSGGMLVTGRTRTLPLRLALAEGAIEIFPDAPEQERFAGANALLALRLEEPPEAVIDWLGYHARHHGATAAVIINRAPPDSAAGGAAEFAEAIERGMEAAGLALPVAIIDSVVPLGKPGWGPENHLFHAPDAPGKDRMQAPEPDLWRAPLGQGLVYEIAKWRYLAHARAVLALDVTDILAARAPLAPTAFDLCAAAQGGVVLLVGRRIYPWRVRDGQRARFGDHICQQFDARRGIARWGVAPAQAGLENTWRAIRVAYARPDPGTVVPFWRAMAIRVPGRAASELAPKTSLVESPELLTLATDAFGWKPVRAPVSAPRAAAVHAAEAGRTCIVTTMKNEGPFILEWLAYHRAIGVDDFLIYTNDCTDGTDTMLQMLQAKGLVQHRENPFRAMNLPPQHAALQAAETEPLIQGCGWAICMDVDEFINIKLGDGTLAALYAAMGDANMISLTWRLFGNSDVHSFLDRFLLEQFTLCAPEVVRKPHQAWGFKTLFRNIDIYKKLGVHRPKGLIPDLWDKVKWLNGSGRPLPREMFRNGWRSTLETYGYDWVQLNHYAVRSVESFLVKRDRGRVNHVDRDQGLNYWFRMNHNAVEDRSIQRMLPALRAELARLLADPEIAAAHAHSVACHRAKIAELRAQAQPEAFHAELTGDRLERLSRLLSHFGSAVFNAGPGVIPPDLHLRDLPADFFFSVQHTGEAEH